MNRSFSFSFIFVTLGSTPKGKEVEQCKCSLACSCSCVYFSTSSCSDYVWNEQSKNCPRYLYESTFVESGLGQWMVHVQWNDRMKRTETEPNWKRFFDAYCTSIGVAVAFEVRQPNLRPTCFQRHETDIENCL